MKGGWIAIFLKLLSIANFPNCSITGISVKKVQFLKICLEYNRLQSLWTFKCFLICTRLKYRSISCSFIYLFLNQYSTSMFSVMLTKTSTGTVCFNNNLLSISRFLHNLDFSIWLFSCFAMMLNADVLRLGLD
jgi:hypothetical protein